MIENDRVMPLEEWLYLEILIENNWEMPPEMEGLQFENCNIFITYMQVGS